MQKCPACRRITIQMPTLRKGYNVCISCGAFIERKESKNGESEST
jgi:rRNA maturation endonuclease Nob1